MWGVRVSVMTCICAWAAQADVTEMPCFDPLCDSGSSLSSEEQSPMKGAFIYYHMPESRPQRFGNLIGLVLLRNDAQPQNKSDEVKSHPVIVPEESVLKWVPATKLTAASLSTDAFIAGKEGWDGSPLWVIRANQSGELIPGKLAIKHRAAYIPHDGLEVPVDNFEVLCASQNSLRWIPVSYTELPVGAVIAGHIRNGEPLYIARCRHMGSTTPGKFDPSTHNAHISFCGKEVRCWEYEILSQVHQDEFV